MPSSIYANLSISALLLLPAPARAADPPVAPAPSLPAAKHGGDRLKLPDVILSLKLGGDLRLRYDESRKRGAGTTDRSRMRLRLRLGAEAQLPDDLLLGLRLASGTGEQNSTNQSYGKLGGGKDIWIDLAYLRWSPSPAAGMKARLWGGKMVNPLWRVYASDLVWDEDLNPEGFGESLECAPGAGGLVLFLNGLQMAADEDSNSAKSQWLFSQQAGIETLLPAQAKLRLAAAYHKWSDENRSALSQPSAVDGNRRAGGVLLNRFGVGELTAELGAKVRGFPLSLQATLARNLRARNNDTTLTGPPARDGYQYGLVAGKAAAARSWELAWFVKHSQADVTVADAADSDFGDAGTNARGHILWAACNPRDWLGLKAKYIVADVIDRSLPPGDKAVNRLQFDLALKF